MAVGIEGRLRRGKLSREGIDVERILDLAAARRPLPVDHPTAALGYRVKDLATPRRQRRTVPSNDPFPRPSQRQSGPSLGCRSAKASARQIR